MHLPLPPIEAAMLIGGARVIAGERHPVTNPAAPEDVVGVIGLAGAAEAKAAIAAAKRAQRGWGRLSFTRRGELLNAALDQVGAMIGSLAGLYARENGRTLGEAEGELASILPNQRQTIGWAAQFDAGSAMDRGAGFTRLRHVPYGVVVSIVPWNAPAALAFLQVIPALLAGNAVVVKPPETCPLTLLALLDVLARALPEGLVNAVTGLPDVIGPTLTTDADVAKIAFTGSGASAARIGAVAALTLKSLTLELGGNDPAILLPGTRPDAAMFAALRRAVFMNTGQVCMAIKRLYLHEDDVAAFVQGFRECVDALVVGNGLLPHVTMGPLHSRAALARSHGFIEDARARGAIVLPLGTIDDAAAFDRGHFMRPTLVTDIADDAPLMVEEQFCPAIPIATYRDPDEAIARANASDFGLSASVWGHDPARAADLATGLEAGTVFVNGHGVASLDRRLPYGGLKHSGQGRKAAREGIAEYCQSQVLTVIA
ncbi:aldehyde dehydrogenase family protein [Novosphingobium album (ex Liu et al. 2023)]|uniref:Aldehyde dehydrogenase family protein n=1 Tax=Novosphingobium album (ex Liu et al. 2023) TaxID=3031130 RepID=A0ABT5WNT4_9SPHN|nr:aldehyde dehydrogenase family protein [Novosphingobium album (ex Liu et al. 2023)]MDE8651539.1 aldehyde dehydrogenase family protein [Novosphingobium album (ex Liu et al. 2023)]